MKSEKSFIRFANLVLALIFVVILAGSVVRTTHSGMGCPDWPRCFGRWIPPMNAGQLPPDFEKYLGKQDIDHSFNAFHTWVEYINRLATVVFSIAVGILIVWSYKLYFKTAKRKAFWLSVWLFVLLLAEAILGFLVVHSNLQNYSVTIHMLPIFLMAGLVIYLVHYLKGSYKINDPGLLKWNILALVLAFIQVVIGTQVRSQVDIISKTFHYEQRNLWISQMNDLMTVHEIFAGIAALACVYYFWKSLSYAKLQKNGFLLLSLLVLEIAMGFTLVNLKFPAFAQPAHLLCGVGIISALYASYLKLSKNKA